MRYCGSVGHEDLAPEESWEARVEPDKLRMEAILDHDLQNGEDLEMIVARRKSRQFPSAKQFSESAKRNCGSDYKIGVIRSNNNNS